MNGKKQSIDSLKGIGILGVVLVHWGLTTTSGLLGGIVGNGARGVQLLFIINAFLIFSSLSQIELSKANIIRWYKRKFLRLIPLYWFFTILYVILVDTRGAYYLGPLPEVSWVNVLCNLFFVHGFYPYYTNSINANWFMGVLGIFYIAAPLLYKVINSLEKAVLAVLIVSPAGFILRHALLSIKVLVVDTIWADYVNIISFPAEFPIILLGILVYYVYIETEKTCWIKSKKLFSIACVFFMAACSLSLILNKGYFMVFNNIFSFGVLLAVFVLSQLVFPVKVFDNKFLALIGKHSYGIYLSHIIIIKYMNLFHIGRGGGIWWEIFGYCILVLMALGISILSEEFIEKRMVHVIRGILKRNN